MMNGINNGSGIGWGWIIGLIVLVIIIVIIVRALNQNKTPQLPIDKSPIDILKERYARGEISKQEFEEKRKGIS